MKMEKGGVAQIIMYFLICSFSQIQTHERFKITLCITTKHNMRMFGVIPFIKLQNDT